MDLEDIMLSAIKSQKDKYQWNVKNKTKQNQDAVIQKTNWCLPAERGVRGVQWVKEDQEVKTSSYKISKSWGHNMQHGEYSP